MLSLSKAQVITIFAAVFLVVLLLFARTKPPLKEKLAVVQDSTGADVEQKLNLAVSYVQDGKEPMKGIMLLREILAQDSNNIKAHFYLGVFSAQSNQWDKAKARFEKVLMLDSTNTEAYFYLGQANANLGDTSEAIKNLEKYKFFIRDEKILDEVDKNINALKK